MNRGEHVRSASGLETAKNKEVKKMQISKRLNGQTAIAYVMLHNLIAC
jgi:hypothetical protein